VLRPVVVVLASLVADVWEAEQHRSEGAGSVSELKHSRVAETDALWRVSTITRDLGPFRPTQDCRMQVHPMQARRMAVVYVCKEVDWAEWQAANGWNKTLDRAGRPEAFGPTRSDLRQTRLVPSCQPPLLDYMF
jgi:hypothetical protein